MLSSLRKSYFPFFWCYSRSPCTYFSVYLRYWFQALARHYFRGVKSEPVPEKVQPVASRTTRSGSIQTLGQSTPFTKPVMATMPRESYQTVTKKQPAAPRKRENSPHDSDDEFDIDVS